MAEKFSTHSRPHATVHSAHNPTQAAHATSPQPSRQDGRPPEDMVRERAYSLWEQAGHPEGDGVEFWLRAEGELTKPM